MTEVTNKMLPLLIALDPELFNQLRPEAQQSEAAQKGYQMATSTEAMAEWLRTETDTDRLCLYLNNTHDWFKRHDLAIALGLNKIYLNEAKEFIMYGGGCEGIDWLPALAKIGLLNDHSFVSKIVDAWPSELFAYMYTDYSVHSHIKNEQNPFLDDTALLTKAINNKLDLTGNYEIEQAILRNKELYKAAVLNGMLEYHAHYIGYAKRKEITQADLFLDIAYGLNKNKDEEKINKHYKNLQYCTERYKNRYKLFITYALQYTDNLDWEHWLKVKKLIKQANPEHALLKTPEDVHAWVQSKQMPKVKAVALPDLMFE